MTAAIVEPICGMRSKSPTMNASTTGDGASTMAAVTPTTVPAITEMTMLPISVKEIAGPTSSGCARSARRGGGASARGSAPASCGLSMSPNSVRNSRA